MNVQFVYPEFLFALWLLPLIGGWWLFLNKKRLIAINKFISSPSQLKEEKKFFSKTTRFITQLILLELGMALAIIAAARPQWGEREETRIQRGRDLVVCIDVSRSMLAKDVQPSRLERAKMDIIDLIKELKGDRIAIVAFRGKAVQLCPLTMDYSFAMQIVNDLSVDSAPRGETDIGDALNKALDAFESDLGSHKAIILISDGEDLAGRALKEAERAGKEGVAIFTVGLGSREGAKIPIEDEKSRSRSYLTHKGTEVLTRLEHETLKKIAEVANGAYVPVGQANVNLGALYKEHLSKIALRENAEIAKRRFIERYQLFLFPAVVAFILAAFLSSGRPALPSTTVAQNGRVKNIVSLLYIILLASCINSSAAPTNQPVSLPISNSTSQISVIATTQNMEVANLPADEIAWRANKLYLQGKYEEAAKLFVLASQKSSRSIKKRYLFNAACSYYRAGNYREAKDILSGLASDNDLKSRASYNLGCARWQEAIASKDSTNLPASYYPETLVEAGTAFQEAYRKDPSLKNAEENLAIITNIFPQAIQESRMKEAIARYGNLPPFQLLDQLLKTQRSIHKQLSETTTNSSPQRIEYFEKIAAQQDVARQMLLPLKRNILNLAGGSSNVQNIAEFLDAIQTNMDGSYEKLRNIENDAFYQTYFLENAVYQLWKGLAQFPQLLDEAILRQSNSLAMTYLYTNKTGSVEVDGIKQEQTETLSLTELFIERFSQAVPPEGLMATPETDATSNDTNAITISPSNQLITAETRSNILQLATMAKFEQTQAQKLIDEKAINLSIPPQNKSLEYLLKIKELLPKDKNQKQEEQQNQQSQNSRSQDQKDNQQQDQKEEKQEEQQNKQNQSNPQENQQQEEEQPQGGNKEQDEKQSEEKDLSPKQIAEMLNKALQREKEYKQKEYQKQYVPPSPIERDW